MAFCPYCGQPVVDDANFCSSCGAALRQAQQIVTAEPIAVNPVAVTPVAAQTVVNPLASQVQTIYTTTPIYAANAVYTGEGYAVMLVGFAGCGALTAANLISDLCGYTDAEAMNLVANAPTLIAQGLNRQQATYLAQCMTEYGLEAAVYDRNGNCTLTSDLDSAFTVAGTLRSKVAQFLSLIGLGNRITGAIRRYSLNHRPVVYTAPRPVQRPAVRRQTFRTQPRMHTQPVKPRAAVSKQPAPNAARRPQTAQKPQNAQKPLSAQKRPGSAPNAGPGPQGHKR